MTRYFYKRIISQYWRILNKKQIDNKVSEIVSEYVSMQEMSMEVVKKYL